MTKKQKIILGSVIGLLSVGLIASLSAVIAGAVGGGNGSGGKNGGGIYAGNGSYGPDGGYYDQSGQYVSGNSSERENMLILAKRYMERGEYERAMNILDNLLIKDATDEDALALMDDVITLRTTTPSGTGAQQNNNAGANSELQQTLEEMAEANRAAAAQNAAMQQLLKEQAEQEALRREQEQLKQKQEEAERLAEKQRQERLAQEEAAKKSERRGPCKKEQRDSGTGSVRKR